MVCYLHNHIFLTGTDITGYGRLKFSYIYTSQADKLGTPLICFSLAGASLLSAGLPALSVTLRCQPGCIQVVCTSSVVLCRPTCLAGRMIVHGGSVTRTTIYGHCSSGSPGARREGREITVQNTAIPLHTAIYRVVINYCLK